MKQVPLNSTILIRLADHGDMSDVMRIIRSCTETLRQATILQWDEIYPGREQVEEDLKDGSLFVAMNAEICLGTASFNEKQEDVYRQVAWNGNDPALVVHRLCVDPVFQGQGIAKQLMNFGEHLALKQGCTSIRLDAYSGNPRAIGLYERLGYRKAGSVTFPRRNLPFYCFEKILAEKSEV